MNTNIAEFEMLLKLQENYFDNLIELGLLYEIQVSMIKR